MWFWLIVGVVLVGVLAAAWLSDRRRKVRITRDNPAVEDAIAAGKIQARMNRMGQGGLNL